MPRLKSDLLTALLAARDGVLSDFDLRWRDEAALTVVMASKGYPGAYEKGHEIFGLEEAATLPGDHHVSCRHGNAAVARSWRWADGC